MDALRAKHKDDEGFTLIEVIVSIAILMVVLVAAASSLAQGQQLERETTSLNRARMIADKVMSQIDGVATPDLGFYEDDTPPPPFTPPTYACRATLSAIITYCTDIESLRRAGNRPATNAAIPPPIQYFDLDGADTTGLAKRKFTATTYIAATAANGAGISERIDKRVFVQLTWRDGTHDREFTLNRYRTNNARFCDSFDSGLDQQGFCTGIISTPFAASAWPQGGFSSDVDEHTSDNYTFGEGNSLIPSKVSGANTITDAAMKFILLSADKSQNTSGATLPSQIAVSAIVKPWNNVSYPMVKDAITGNWTYTLPTSINITTTSKVTYTVTYRSGATDTIVTNVRPITYTATKPVITGVSSAALPNAVGTPTGSLFLGSALAASTTTPTGTAKAFLCTKTDGSLWQNHKFYFEMATNKGEPDSVRYLANTPTSPITGSKLWNEYGADSQILTGGTPSLVMERIVTGTAGAATNTTRWSVVFPTQAQAVTSKMYYNGSSWNNTYTGPRFFTPTITLLIEDTRELDNAKVLAAVTIPVRRAATSAGCSSNGDTTQPTY